MPDRPVRRRFLALVVAGGCLAASAAGCVPLENSPPGGGETLTQTFNYGPFTLGPGGELQGSPSSGMPRPSGAFGLKEAKFAVVDTNGNAVSTHDVHLHHIVMTTSARQDRLCPGRAERFIGAGMERTPIYLWGPYTYLVGANDQWGSIWHLMNETSQSKTVYIQYKLRYQPGANATNSRPVNVYFQDVDGCGDSTYDIPGTGGPGSVHTATRTWTAPDDGLAVYTGGHLHDGGIDTVLRNDTTGETFCTSTATYHENPHHLATINSCLLHHQINQGDTIRLSARYDNSQPWEDVMGINLSYVWWGEQ